MVLDIMSHLQLKSCLRRDAQLRRGKCTPRAAAATPTTKDAFIANALELVPHADAHSEKLKAVQQQAIDQLSTAQMPTRADESFRFFNLTKLLENRLQRPSDAPSSIAASEHPQVSEDAAQIVFVNGQMNAEASSVSGLPDSMYVGSLQNAPAQAQATLGGLSSQRGGVFTWLNTATSADVQVCYVPAGIECTVPVHIVSVSSSASEEGTAVMYSPRILIVAEEGAKIEVIEEFVGREEGSGAYFMNSITEVALSKNATVTHRMLQNEANGAFHIKNTFVQQAESSSYELVEVSLGGKLARHDVNIQQGGPQTETTMRHFLLCGSQQLHDLHTSLVLDHPEGVADQLHKCIVSDSTGHGVFDGEVKVNKLAQQTDAGQLSRNLLLVPKATVNVKPNLQIIADDVKCTHGCAVSDLSDDELFYFRARGIDAEVARKALVYSFGAEVVQMLNHEKLVERIRTLISDKLDASV